MKLWLWSILLTGMCGLPLLKAQAQETDGDRAVLDSALHELRFMVKDSAFIDEAYRLAPMVRQHNPAEATALANEGLQVALRMGDSTRAARGYLIVGRMKRMIGDYEESSQLLFKAIAMLENEKASGLYASAANSLGILYTRQGNVPRAYEWYRKGLAVYQKLPNGAQGAASVMMNLGNLYAEDTDLESANNDTALYYYNEALQIGLANGFEGTKASAYNNIGHVHMLRGQWIKAIDLNTQSLELNKELNRQGSQVTNLCNIGESYINLGRYEQAREYLEEALALAEALRSPYYLRLSLHWLKECFTHLGLYQEALGAYERWRVFDDSLRADRVSAQINDLQAKHDLALVQADNERLEAQNESQNRSLLVGRMVMLALLLVLLTLSMVLFWYRVRRKSSQLGAELNKLKGRITVLEEENHSLREHQAYYNAQAQALPTAAHNEAEEVRHIITRMAGLAGLMPSLKAPTVEEMGQLLEHYQESAEKLRQHFGTLYQHLNIPPAEE